MNMSGLSALKRGTSLGKDLPRLARKMREISEKSLELNVCAELLHCVRSIPGCGKALWVGLTQDQESREGIDERLRGTQNSVSLMLQFKSPAPTSISGYFYRFSISIRQHQLLMNLANRYPDAVSYVFPLYSEWQKADQDAPRSLAGKPSAGFCATPSRRIPVLYGPVVHVRRCNTHRFIDNRR